MIMSIFKRLTLIFAAVMAMVPAANADLYICGENWGWNVKNFPAMQKMDTDEEEYVWNGWLNPGEVKFLFDKASWTPGLVCSEGYQNGITLGRAYGLTDFNGDNSRDYKFRVNEGGYYDVHVNLSRRTVVFSHSLLFIGHSRTTGFNKNQGIRMTPVGEGRFMATVAFGGGTSYFGFCRAFASDGWYDNRIGPSDARHVAVKENATFGLADFNADSHDSFTTDAEGAWTITVDLNSNSVSFRRAEISAMGNVNNDNGWSPVALTGLKSVGNGISSGTVNVSGNGYFILTKGGGNWDNVNASRISPNGDRWVGVNGNEQWSVPSDGTVTRPAAKVKSQVWIHNADLWTDRAVYAPGEKVWIQFAKFADYPDAMVRYRHHADVLAEHPLQQEWWEWTPPTDDFKGYMVDVYTREGDTENIIATIGVDVSSSWTRFPRNGYTAWFEPGKEQYIPGDVAFLNRRHINVVQFQDWHWRHHRPYSPAEQYTDISNRAISKNVVRTFIDTMHGYNMKTLFYNLCYGALGQDGAAADGVREEWYMFTRPGHDGKDYHPLLDIGWKSNIDLTNPGNAEWQNYMADRVGEVYDNLGFDGYQVDQLGYRCTHYDYWSNVVDERDGYAPFLQKMKSRFPNKSLIMNAVGDFGGDRIAKSGAVDACYTEMWNGERTFHKLYWNIFDNNNRSGNTLKTIFACYMNYDFGRNNPGKEFNAPGVLLTDACMFALGGCHLELGTGGNMLCNEYFPNTNLRIGEKLMDAITHYYDFITAYENLIYECKLFDNKVEREVTIASPTNKISQWTYRQGPRPRRINILAREADSGKRVFHLLNFMNVNDLSWRDLNGDRPEPPYVDNIELHIDSDVRVNRVWAASPDFHGGAPVDLQFTQSGRVVTLKVPNLKYWTMVVFE